MPSSASTGPNRLLSPLTSITASPNSLIWPPSRSLMPGPGTQFYVSAGSRPVRAADTGLIPVSRHCRVRVHLLSAAWPAGRAAGRITGTRMRVLVAEDVEDLATAIAAGLRREGMAVDVVLDGTTALDQLAFTAYDVVVLDRDLPGTHGDEICRRLSAQGSGSRVLMLTAASTVRDRVEGLGLGADDYLPKPF